MSIRETINQEPALGVGLLVVILAVAGVFIWRQMRTQNAPPVVSNWFYYDITSKQLVVKPSGPPVSFKTPEGHMLILAHVYTCGDKSKQFTAYYERYNPQSQAMVDQAPHMGAQPGGAMSEVSRDLNEWVPISTPQGAAIMQVACPDGQAGTPTMVMPGSAR
ncbi:MAG TPA: hypothetical protein VIL86_18415 [Tepidisphaeraceae bacterium]|jgi:hypothetical protein